mgnify:CR=1 FL=1
MWCCKSEWPGLVCFVAINPCGLSANRADVGFFVCLFHKFSNFTPPPQKAFPAQTSWAWPCQPSISHAAEYRKVTWSIFCTNTLRTGERGGGDSN